MGSKLVFLIPIVVLLSACNEGKGGGAAVSVDRKVTTEGKVGQDSTHRETISENRTQSDGETLSASATINSVMAFVPEGKSPKDVKLMLMGSTEPEKNSGSKAEGAIDYAKFAALDRAYFTVAVSPVISWEVPLPPPKGFGLMAQIQGIKAADSQKLKKQMNDYLRVHEIGVCIADKSGGDIAKAGQARGFANQSLAREFAVAEAGKLLATKARDLLAECSDSVDSSAKAGRHIDGTGFKGIAWRVGDHRYECSQEGCKMTVNGVAVFGPGGVYQMARYDIKFDRVSSQGSDSGISDSISVSGGAGSQKSANVKVGN